MIFHKTIDKKTIRRNILKNKKIQISIKRKKFERKQECLKLCRLEVKAWT